MRDRAGGRKRRRQREGSIKKIGINSLGLNTEHLSSRPNYAGRDIHLLSHDILFWVSNIQEVLQILHI